MMEYPSTELEIPLHCILLQNLDITCIPVISIEGYIELC